MMKIKMLVGDELREIPLTHEGIHNLATLFAWWFDEPLAQCGKIEARECFDSFGSVIRRMLQHGDVSIEEARLELIHMRVHCVAAGIGSGDDLKSIYGYMAWSALGALFTFATVDYSIHEAGSAVSDHLIKHPGLDESLGDFLVKALQAKAFFDQAQLEPKKFGWRDLERPGRGGVDLITGWCDAPPFKRKIDALLEEVEVRLTRSS